MGSTGNSDFVFSRAFQRPTGADQRLPSGSSLVAGGPTACSTSRRFVVFSRAFWGLGEDVSAIDCKPSADLASVEAMFDTY